jgi:prevent-host-death family protein
MRPLRVSEDVVPIGQFKGKAARWLQRVDETGAALVITRNGKAAGVLMSPREFDLLRERDRLLLAVAAGVRDADSGRVLSTSAVRERLRKHRSRR